MGRMVRDDNFAPVIGGVSSADDTTVISVRVDPTLKALNVNVVSEADTHTEDSAHSSGDTGTFILAVRQDTATQLAGTDGDYSPIITDANGRLHVLDANSAAIKTAVEVIDNAVATEGSALGSGVLIQGDDGTDRTNVLVDTAGHLQVDILSGGGGTQYAEDAAHTTGDSGMLALVVRQDTATQLAGTDGDYSVLINDASGRLHVLDANSAAIKTAVELIDNAISGTEMQVDVVAALPTGTNAIGKLAANSGVDIGDVDVTTVPAPLNVSGGGLEATALRVTIASDSTGVLSIDDNSGSLTVDNAGTFAVQVDGNALTALQKIDDPVLVDDAAFTPATSSVMMAGFEFDDTTPDSVDEGDAGAARMSANRNIYITIRDAAGNERGVNVDASNQLTVAEANSTAIKTAVELIDNAISGTEMQVDIVAALPAGTNAIGKLVANSGVDIGDVDVLSIIPGTGATNLGKAEDAVHSSSDTGVMALAVRNDVLATLAGTDGDYAPIQVDAEGGVYMRHSITGIGHGVTTVTTAGTDVVLAASTPCKRVVLQAQTDNTNYIAVGASGVDATEATGTGVMLGAGDSFELEVDNLADIYIDSLVNGEGVRYTYFV